MISFMNISKNKLRMNVSLLEALLRIKTQFVNDSCCNFFVPTKQMHEKFNYTMYDFKNVKAQEVEQTEELFDVGIS
jgi:hypothetical protein